MKVLNIIHGLKEDDKKPVSNNYSYLHGITRKGQ